jgi:hypothetical protein
MANDIGLFILALIKLIAYQAFSAINTGAQERSLA